MTPATLRQIRQKAKEIAEQFQEDRARWASTLREAAWLLDRDREPGQELLAALRRPREVQHAGAAADLVSLELAEAPAKA